MPDIFHHQNSFYDLRGSTNKEYTDKANKLMYVLQNHNVSFEYNEDLYILVTKVVLPSHFVDKLIASEKIAYELYCKFKTVLLQDERSTWKPLCKTKLPTLKSALARTKMKIVDKVVQPKEVKQRLAKFFISMYLDILKVMNFQFYLYQCFNESVASGWVPINHLE